MTWEEISKELFEEKTEKRFRVHELVKYNYSEIGEYTDENHTDRPLMNDEVVELLNKLSEENMMLKGEVAHYKLILMSLEEQAKRISQIHCLGDKE